MPQSKVGWIDCAVETIGTTLLRVPVDAFPFHGHSHRPVQIFLSHPVILLSFFNENWYFQVDKPLRPFITITGTFDNINGRQHLHYSDLSNELNILFHAEDPEL